MARLKGSRLIKWVGVEFQPSLTRPKKPIRLGAILVETIGTSTNVSVIGRMPLRDQLPEELRGLGEITIGVVSGWCDPMLRDAVNADGNIFDILAAHWKWNLFITAPRSLPKSEMHGSLYQIAVQIYEKFVGLPFKDNVRRNPLAASPRPATWHLRAFTGNDAGQFISG